MTALLATLASFRLRIVFRAAFLLLVLATLGMALHVLNEEKQRGIRNYRESFGKTREQIAARLRHPSGQLALLNPQAPGVHVVPLRPVLLPFSALDFDDQNKVRNAVEMAGCLTRYHDGGALCVAIGNNPWAGGFIYAAGSFDATRLQPHRVGERAFDGAHRVRVEVALRGQTYRWIAPFETVGDAAAEGLQGRLTGFVEGDGDYARARPVRDFRGWIWQSPQCLAAAGQAVADADCRRNVFFSVRLPVGILRDALFGRERPQWPPADLERIAVRVEVLAPGDGAPLFDSNRPDATPPFALRELKPLLLPGETLTISRGGSEMFRVSGAADSGEAASPLLAGLIRRLPVDGYGAPVVEHAEIATASGSYALRLDGDARGIDRQLNVVATRLSWFVGAMLLAILLTWFVIEIGVIRRIARLTRRAQALSATVRDGRGPERFDLSDSRGGDELGILATCLHELLQRVREDVERERIRTAQEKEMWHAVGHEIMSPLQSLLALHGGEGDPSQRYISRMQQAVRVLYGSASPSEAFAASTLRAEALDLAEFLEHVASNAACVGIADVVLHAPPGPLPVRADEYPLEDVVTHVLRNADRHRRPGTPITLTLTASATAATLTIGNSGEPIAGDMLERIFEYGVSEQADSGAAGRRGQGLFVARTYLAKMGGTIVARNVAGGVEFVIGLARAG